MFLQVISFLQLIIFLIYIIFSCLIVFTYFNIFCMATDESGGFRGSLHSNHYQGSSEGSGVFARGKKTTQRCQRFNIN